MDLGIYINADEIEKSLEGPPSEERSKVAQAEAERRRQQCLADGQSFTFETVMSHPSKVALLAQAREAGFYVVMYFVALEDPSLNVQRVRQRVALGGHPVPEDRIAARYHRCLALLPTALGQCDHAVLLDNSYRETEGGRVGMRPFCEIVVARRQGEEPKVVFYSTRGGALSAADEVPRWALDILPSAVLRQRRRPIRAMRRGFRRRRARP